MGQGRKPGARRRGIGDVLPVVLISLLALEIAVLVGGWLGTLEAQSADLRMRLRRRLGSVTRIHPALTLVAIDAATQQSQGRYGAGQWLGRRPFVDQLGCFERLFTPSVLAYDIIFQPLGGVAATDRVSEAPARLERIVRSVSRVAADPGDAVSETVLADLNRLSIEQGNLFLAHRLASVMEKSRFPVLLGYNFRGGVFDRKTVSIPGWSDADVFGDSAQGDEEQGARIPYLKDIAIPDASIHFAPGGSADRYPYAVNANLPEWDFLDYVQLGALNAAPDADSIVRRVPLVVGFTYRNTRTRERHQVFVPSFSLMSCLLHLGVRFPLSPSAVKVRFGREIRVNGARGGPLHIPIDEQGCLYLNYEGRFDDFPAVSFGHLCPSDLAAGGDAPGVRRAASYRRALDGRLVVVGVSATGIDVGACPVEAPVPMVIAQLTAMNNILQRRFLRPLGPLQRRLLMAALFAALTGLCLEVRSSRLGAVALEVIVLYSVAGYVGVHLGWAILPMVAPLLYVTLCSFSVLTLRYFTVERERRVVRGMFSTMVSNRVLNYLEENPDSFSLHGHNVTATVFFSDVADFTTMSEHLPPQQVTELLNTYLTPVTDNILGHGGFLDKYTGDGVMAVWGAPYPDPEHAVRACHSALDQQAIVREMTPMLRDRFGIELNVRMGLSSGTVTAGNMGSQKRFQFTVMGDVVNLAFRTEPANKEFGTQIIISDRTREMLGDRFEVRPLGRIVVQGRHERVEIHELLGQRGKVDAVTLESVRRYAAALDLFYEREWDACLAILNALPADGPARHLARLARGFSEQPPPADWQGEYTREAKR